MENGFIFILETTDGDIIAARRPEIEAEIKRVEESGEELSWTTIGRLKEHPGLSVDFNPKLIEWFKKEGIYAEETDSAVIAVINLLMGLG